MKYKYTVVSICHTPYEEGDMKCLEEFDNPEEAFKYLDEYDFGWGCFGEVTVERVKPKNNNLI